MVDWNVKIEKINGFTVLNQKAPAVWQWIDNPSTSRPGTSSSLAELQEMPVLSFPLRYQLEVCISQGILNEHNLTDSFVKAILALPEGEAIELLEDITLKEKRIYDPMSLFIGKKSRGPTRKAGIPAYCAYSRKALVTPTMVYYTSPTVETSNRILRKYSEYSDRFLRVQFTDEKIEVGKSPTSLSYPLR